MRTLKLTIAYDGTRYAGWQVQRRGTRKPTVQGTIEQTLRQILQEPVNVVGSGRTDAGVHALAQIAHLKTRTIIPHKRLLRSLNQLLPHDIAITHLEEANGSFHARFDTVAKRYRYRLFTGAVVPPFIRPYVHHVGVPLNTALMRREAASLRGRHDVRAFARTGQAARGTVRTITRIELRRRGAELHLNIEGTGFLHTMVRSIMGTLIDIGRGRLPAGTIRRMLRTGDRRLAGTTAPPHGLTLVSVDYA